MLFVCRSKIVHKLQFLLGVKMALRETKNNAYAKVGVANKEHFGMLWYFLEWSIEAPCTIKSRMKNLHPSYEYLIQFIASDYLARQSK